MSGEENSQSPDRQSLGSVIRSVLASMFGVQSSGKHAEDFSKGSVFSYVAVGLVATILFVLTVWSIVKLVVSTTQPS
ncbi:MAG: hypothetical protein BMS9Abin09_0892 [Gammaproteobacteria bacterium]|nr:MAG: hypothetical protein BMS9Abin09_0892 [Gammaproteobacteria bacterium]